MRQLMPDAQQIVQSCRVLAEDPSSRLQLAIKSEMSESAARGFRPTAPARPLPAALLVSVKGVMAPA
jgi:hypothetical protein